MNPNRVAIRRVIVVAACAVMGLLLPDCTKTPDIGPSGNGGAVGYGGQTESMGGNDTTTATGGANDHDAAIVTYKLDAPPLWWGSADAEPDAPPAPTVDANCGIVTSNTTREPVDVLLVLDRSASMDYSINEDCYCSRTTGTFGNLCADTTNCTTRWDAIEPAVTATLSSSGSAVDWGLKFFPSSSNSNCGVTTGVEVKIDPNSAADVQAQIASATKSLGTPTTAAINAATAYLQTLTDSNKKVILVATDGEPNCGGSPASINTDDVTGASAAAAAALTAGFPVYVVGIGPNLDNLTQLASAGGTTDYFPANSPQQLTDALSSISKLVGSCSFTSDKTPQDPNNIAVYVNKQQVAQDSGNGWTFGSNPQEIVLTGSYCDDITAGKDTAVQILFGCPGAPPFPPYVP
jgi:hypothetical protein